MTMFQGMQSNPSSSALIRAIITAVIVHVSRLEGISAELRFVHGKYDGSLSVDDARNWITLFANSNRIASSPVACTAEASCPWYIVPEKQTSAARREDVGLLLTCDRDAKGGFDCTHCTAFYVGNDLLMAAGHCVVRVGNVEPTKRLMLFLHRYDGKQETSSAADKSREMEHGRIVTEWWVAEGYYNHVAEECGSSKSGSDMAFLRVDKPKVSKDRFYELSQPGSLVEHNAPVQMIGYAEDQAVYRRPVKVESWLYAADSPGLKKLLQPNIKESDQKMYQASKLLVLVARNKGTMYGGGSGGPVFQDDNGQKAETARKVVGINVFAWRLSSDENGNDVRRDPRTQKTEASFTPTFTKDLIDAMLLLRAHKAVPTVAGKPIPVGVEKSCG